MFLAPFVTEDAEGVRIAAAQGSRFAKQVAGDFNPIHDPDNRRFCVPGDLLFALVLGRYGVSPRMHFTFSGMLGAGIPLRLPAGPGEAFELSDGNGRSCLAVRRQGPADSDPDVAERLVRSYVAFSGRNFPHILVPLMRRHGVMINTERPLVVYESMAFELQRSDCPDLALALTDSRLEHNGKRGEAQLHFRFTDAAGQTLGEGRKRLLLSGLRPYNAEAMDALVARYDGWKAAYEANTGAGRS